MTSQDSLRAARNAVSATPPGALTGHPSAWMMTGAMHRHAMARGCATNTLLPTRWWSPSA